LKDRLYTTLVLAYTNFILPFILTKDASEMAVGAILSQVKDGVERPISYTSRQKNRQEQLYSALESEMLALIWANKHFRLYLLSKKFLVRIDHAALTYLRNFSDQNFRLLRWSIKLSELGFVVEHKAGSKMTHVDALRRHVGNVTHGNLLDRENVLREQAKDAFCTKQTPGTYRSKQDFFLDDDGILYELRSDGKHQLVVRETLIAEVIKQNHDPTYTSHPGNKRAYSLISLRFGGPEWESRSQNT
jgi:hypothetical protein